MNLRQATGPGAVPTAGRVASTARVGGVERPDVRSAVGGRSPWRAVAMPSEHGGWGLTLEPVVLGLLIAPSLAGLSLGVAAFLAFLVRTPLKLVFVDVRRGRWLARTGLALRVAIGELVVLAVLGALAASRAGWAWLIPVAIAVPLVAVELWFDIRSRGRRLVPELCGSVGIAAAAAAILIVGGERAALAAGAWLVLAARALGAMPFVRVQIARLRRGVASVWHSDVAQATAVIVAVAALLVDRRVAAGAGAAAVLSLLHVVWVRQPPIPAKQLGVGETILGIGLVVATATGVLLA